MICRKNLKISKKLNIYNTKPIHSGTWIKSRKKYILENLSQVLKEFLDINFFRPLKKSEKTKKSPKSHKEIKSSNQKYKWIDRLKKEKTEESYTAITEIKSFSERTRITNQSFKY